METSWIKTHMRANRGITPPQLLLQPEDIHRIMWMAEGPVEKALVSLHWETGGRVGEILNVRAQDVSFEDELAAIRLDGKTGPRMVYVCESARRLRPLVEGKQEEFIFQNRAGRPMSYGNFCRIIRGLGKLARISKPLNTHFFRHSRATYLARQGWSESQLCAYLGWVQGSSMARVYIHMAASDLKEAVLKLQN